MTTEKEFWNLAGQYFRKELGINEDEQTINEGCVGCCKVVDVAAKLQEELDECNERCTLLGSHNMQITANLLDRKAIIEELKDRNTEDLNELYALDKAELSSMKSDYEIILQNRRNMGDKLEDNIKGLEAELSARKEDSQVLKKVVELTRDWLDTPMPDRSAMNRIEYLVRDYLDAPEGPPETSIDENRDITITFAFLELP